MPDRLGVRYGLAGLFLSLLLVAGCTTVPTQEFATYKETFTKARAAGEEVLLDHAAAAAQFDDIKAKLAAAKPMQRKRVVSFDPAAAGAGAAGADDVLVRVKAWEVVARYNDLLTALAEGRAAAELAGAVDGLSASLTSFPIAKVAATAADVSGYLAPLKPLALEAVREESRRQFVAAVGKGTPLITNKFLKLLRDDTVDFYNTRLGLNDWEISVLTDSIGATSTRLIALAASFPANRETDEALAGINADIERLPVVGKDGRSVAVQKLPAQRGTAVLTPEAKAQIGSLSQEMRAQIAKVAAKDDELNAYRQVLTRYVVLLDQLEHSMRQLQTAAEAAQPGIPPAADLQRVVVLLREAYITYKDKGKD